MGRCLVNVAEQPDREYHVCGKPAQEVAHYWMGDLPLCHEHARDAEADGAETSLVEEPS